MRQSEDEPLTRAHTTMTAMLSLLQSLLYLSLLLVKQLLCSLDSVMRLPQLLSHLLSLLLRRCNARMQLSILSLHRLLLLCQRLLLMASRSRRGIPSSN